MDENPYKAPQEAGGRRPSKSRFWWRFLDLVVLVAVAIAVVMLLLIVQALVETAWRGAVH